ncbi:MAG: hypothetical protein MUE81_21800, partial [Thermoflexibacter sp.]|nr:hypothetical protein [Thermoflexibacter sp.]
MTYFLFHTFCLGAFWAFYQVFLKRDTFFERNRYYLLLSCLLTCLIPLAEVSVSEIVNWEEMPLQIQESYAELNKAKIIKQEENLSNDFSSVKVSSGKSLIFTNITYQEIIKLI